MRHLAFRHILIILLLFSITAGTGYAVPPGTFTAETGILPQRKAKKAQKKADAKEKKKKKAIKDGSKATQKRTYEIQTPEVQARMKQNKKNAAARDKAKKKNNKSRTKRGAKKYK